MDREQMKAAMGMNQGEGKAFYKLNKVQMSGDDGTFKLVDLMSEREKGARPNSEELGKSIEGVILKMRWQLSRFEESGSYNSTEYDNKWEDEVTIYPNKEKGTVEAMKAKYNLSTQRVVYFYLASKKEIVRLIVKSSAFSKEKNPNGELGLWDYIAEFGEDLLACEFMTICTGVARKGTNKDGSENKRKNHVAMSFKRGAQLTEVQFAKIQELMEEVQEKTTNHVEVRTYGMDDKSQNDESAPNESQQIDKAFDEAFKDNEVSKSDLPF